MENIHYFVRIHVRFALVHLKEEIVNHTESSAISDFKSVQKFPTVIDIEPQIAIASGMT